MSDDDDRVVRKIDTPWSYAARVLRDGNRWKELLAMNPRRGSSWALCRRSRRTCERWRRASSTPRSRTLGPQARPGLAIAMGATPAEAIRDEVARVVPDEYREGIESLREVSRALSVLGHEKTTGEERDTLIFLAGQLRGLALRFERHAPHRSDVAP